MERQEDVVECVRSGTVRWTAGHFETMLDQRACNVPEKPVRIVIDPEGRLRALIPVAVSDLLIWWSRMSPKISR